MSPRPIALRRVRPLQAHMLGLRQPVVLAYLALDAVPDDLPARLHTALAPYVPATHLPALEVLQGVLPVLAALVAGLQEAGGLPVLESARRLSPDGAAEHVLALPALSPQAATAALQWLVSLASALAQTPAQTGLLPAQEASLQALLRQLSKLAPAGQNNRHFIRAAHRMGLPCRELPGGVWLYGWGRRARLLRSSITGTTSAIGVGWAKDKLATSALLRLAGLPVPEQHLARTAEEAVAIAKRLGFPVVVKPAELDQGLGVEAGLQNPHDVQRAYARAASLSPKTLIEKHITGKDYRLLVLQGQLVWANERVPAGVTGDGASSLAHLIAQANQDPRRGTHSWSQMSPITLNDEAHELLAAAGLSLDGVPAQGTFVRLRRAANVSSGGTPVACFERVHPDNARLAEQAAQLLRLDIAGVDLLVPDIAVSWRVSGGGICEVNAQPQLSLTSPHIYGQVLRRLMPGDGRVPACLVLAPAGSRLAQGLSQRLRQQGLAAQQARDLAALPACLMDPACGALVLQAEAGQLLQGGVPLDRFDVLVLDEAALPAERPGDVLSLLKAHVSALVMRSDKPEVSALCGRYFDNKSLHLVTNEESLLAIVAELMRSSEQAHAAAR